MSIVDGTGLIEWEGGLFAPDSALLPRVRWAFAQIRTAGGDISLNEAGRPYGVASDTAVGRAGADSAGTLSGRSTVYYQWGRYLLWRDTGGRQGTPSAADPSVGPMASEHTQGIAIDCDTYQPALRAKYFAMVGLKNTIASESWHWAIRGPVQDGVDLAAYGGNSIERDEDMAFTDEQAKQLLIAVDILGKLQNAISDPEKGVRRYAHDAAEWAGNANTIASDVRNLIEDPDHGILKRLTELENRQ